MRLQCFAQVIRSMLPVWRADGDFCDSRLADNLGRFLLGWYLPLGVVVQPQ
jgi:hypothetical protein